MMHFLILLVLLKIHQTEAVNKDDTTLNATSTPTSVEDIRHNLVQNDRPQIFVPPFFSNIFNKGATAAETHENAAKAGIPPVPVRKLPELQESQHPMQTKMMLPKTALPKYQPYFPYPFWSLLQNIHSNNMHNPSPSGPTPPRTYSVDKGKLQNQNLFENGMNFIPSLYPTNNIKPWPMVNSQPNAMPMMSNNRPIMTKQFQYPVPQFELPRPKPTPPTFILRTQLPPTANFKTVNEIEDKQQHQHTQMINYLDRTNSIVNPETRPIQYQMEPPLLNVDDLQQPLKASGYYHQPSSSINNDSTTYMLSLEQSPINFCNPLEFNEQVLASLNLKRVDYFIANMSCSSVFFQCSMQTTFVRRCAGADQVFDESTVNCNYRHSVKSCLEYDHVLHCTIKNQCLSDEYACCAAPQQCIPYAKRCDGIVDCADGEDENNCPTCSINEFPCLIGGTCIPMERRCNGMPDDCFDNSNADEKYCEYCGVGKFYCYKSDPNYEYSCIDANQRCDGVKDCQGGEDELNCKRQGAQFLLCENQRQSVPRKQWCDGNEDCADGSDEIYCEY
ncbi:putative Low-density lipoprotein receptor domain class A [Trichinella nativa]|uniref:Putative Low-density lipoprotein receptor domain class A n=1 Tax=Trichinella nativa TaxID=6335 RepID=A0A1Y3EE50_9BILA|nr:putative Low-density lipoprotein receptor domain class A [Trichinella nativa]